MSRRQIALTVVLPLMFFNGSVAQAQAPACQVRVILFVPSDVPVPAGYQQRVDQIVNYSESFLQNEFKRWGHADKVMPFRRSSDGHVEVSLVRGEKRALQYKDATVRGEAIHAAVRQAGHNVGRQVWWVMVYVGDPPKKFRVFGGGFDTKLGGWSVCNFDTREGKIEPSDPLGSNFLSQMNLKAVIHELGHGFQLPHIGPRLGDNAGNSLMGPTHARFRRVAPKRDPRVYLSEAAAAILSTNPAFRGVPDDRRRLPRTSVSNMNYRGDSQQKSITVQGRLKSDTRAVYALVADEVEAWPGEYWTKTYVGKISADGTFTVTVSEPASTDGTLKTWFVFENGAQTGNGKLRGKKGGLVRQYTHSQSGWTFK